ncbi:hypothetical protein BH23CHL2_BH23CHL2_15910 [soil metagenome]
MRALHAPLTAEFVKERLDERAVRAVLEALGVEKFNSNGPENWFVSAPYREDRRPSCSVHRATGVFNDKTTDEAGDIFQLVMMSTGRSLPDAVELVANAAGMSGNGRTPVTNAKPAGRIVESYSYVDEHGEILYYVDRFADKTFKPRLPDGRRTYSERRILYRLPELLASENRWVFLLEGEKDVDRAWAEGIVATTSPGGSNGWKAGYTDSLRGRRIVIVPDNDDPGWKYARAAAHDLQGIAAEICVVELPGLGPRLPKGGKDLSDWLDDGHDTSELDELISNAPQWEPGQHESDQEEPAKSSERKWPDPLDEAAFHGLAGDVVRALEPYTEADPAALLFTFLLGVGNAVGRGPHWSVSGSNHSLNEFAVLVGETSKGRKGTAAGTMRQVFQQAASEWYARASQTGLSSGEGLIWAVRDQIIKRTPIKEKGVITGYQDEIVDDGVKDKRLLITEEEFASTLRVMGRDGNSLSGVIRQAWDHGDLRTMTKNTPAVATGAHVTIIGHSTRDELLRYLNDTEAANGFANRFSWVAVRRSKLLPDGGNPDPVIISNLATRVRTVLEASRNIDLIERDEVANAIWREVYEHLSSGRPGLLGAITSRAEAHVMRFAAIYAVLDMSNLIRTEHLNAALAVWKYAEDSAAYIFGDAMGDPIADQILRSLRNTDGLTRTEISNLFGRHVSSGRLDHALGVLLAADKVTSEKESTGGRPVERWRAR